MSRKSTSVALGGVFSALCLVLMFMTGLIPFSSYALPALAGAMLVAVVLEISRKAAVMVYISVSILSIFIVPDREAAMMFFAFFGYYPILKGLLEQIHCRIAEYAIKLALFNTMIVAGYAILAFMLGVTSILEDTADFGKYSILFLLLSGNVIFIVYDFALTKYITMYVRRFRPHFLRK